MTAVEVRIEKKLDKIEFRHKDDIDKIGDKLDKILEYIMKGKR